MDLSNIIVKSRNPMYYIDDSFQIVELPNVYDDSEVIEIKRTIGTDQIPINKRITIIVSLGLFLFRSKEDAINFGKLLDNPDLLVKNSTNQGVTKDNIVSFSVENTVESGLYTIKQFDDGLTNQRSRNDYCYIENEKDIHEIKQIIPESNEDGVITEYINRISKLDNLNLSNNLVIFEILYEKGKVYVSHYVIDNNYHSSRTLLITDINAYRVYKNKHSAKGWLYNLKVYGRDRELEEIKNMNDAVQHARQVRQVKKDTAMKILKIIGKYAWSYKGVIFDKAIKFIKQKIPGGDILSGEGIDTSSVEEQILEMIKNGEVNFAK